MNRYFLFIYDTYYPQGGMNDFVDDFDNYGIAIEAAKGQTSGSSFENWHVWDTHQNSVVAYGTGKVEVED